MPDGSVAEMIFFSPPLIITEQQIDRVLETVRASIKAVVPASAAPSEPCSLRFAEPAADGRLRGSRRGTLPATPNPSPPLQAPDRRS